MAYTPIHVGEKNDQMIAECSELGSFPRELRLSALSVQPEPSRIFETPLGTSQAQMITVKNLSHLNAMLNCSVCLLIYIKIYSMYLRTKICMDKKDTHDEHSVF